MKSAAAALLGLAALASAVHVEVQPHRDECFMEMLEAQNKMKGSFEVISGGLLDIDVTVFGPHGEAHYSVQRQKQGTFTVMAQTTGLYRVCFSNRMSTLTEKTVAFSLHTGDDLYQSIAKQEHISPLEQEITQLVDAVDAVEDEQRYLWARERASRDTNESTNTRVVMFSVIETLIMIGLAVWQIRELTKLFETRRSF